MNHAIIKSRQFFNEHRLDEVIRKINDRRFNGVFKVTKFNDVYWEIEHPVTDWRNKLCVTVETRRTLHLRKQIGGDFNHWMQSVFQEEIAAAFNGRCGDQGVSAVWDPDPTTYPTFRAYYNDVAFSRARLTKKEKEVLNGYFLKMVKELPKDLQVFAGVKL